MLPCPDFEPGTPRSPKTGVIIVSVLIGVVFLVLY